MAQKFNVGDKVTVGQFNTPGVIASYDKVTGYGVDVTDPNNGTRRVTVVESGITPGNVPLENTGAINTGGVGSASNDAPDPEILLGSGVQPSVFTLTDGTTLSLGDVVRSAFINSGLTLTAWNAQTDAQREELIQDTVNGLKLAA